MQLPYSFIKLGIVLVILFCFGETRHIKRTKKTNIIFPEAHNITKNYYKRSIKNLPKKKDLPIYLSSLRKMVHFFKNNLESIDMNLAFGLFLINVNLKISIRDYYKKIPIDVLIEIRHLLDVNSKLLSFFYSMVKSTNNKEDSQNKMISSLFSSDDIWVNRVNSIPMQTIQFYPTNYEALERTYHHWEQYLSNVFEWSSLAVPGPRDSDRCISSLVENDVPLKRVHASHPICKLKHDCYSFLVNGTDYGYFLSHRLLWVIVAHYGRGCALFSVEKDQEIIHNLCRLSYAEAQYIAYNQFGIIDLMMEQIAFCSFEGYTEFLRHAWIEELLKSQKDIGCFGFSVTDPEDPAWKPDRRKWKIAKKAGDQDIVGHKCNSHFSGVAVAALSTAVRYIISVEHFPKFKPLVTG